MRFPTSQYRTAQKMYGTHVQLIAEATGALHSEMRCLKVAYGISVTSVWTSGSWGPWEGYLRNLQLY